jgi:leucyl/phenylalanyl-tRNA--protein transferase
VRSDEVDPEALLAAYRRGWFPMDEEDEAGPVAFYDADPRALLPIRGFRLPRSVARAERRRGYGIRVDGDFAAVVRACGDRPGGTWLSPRLAAAYLRLHDLGHAHSVECLQAGRLVGGLFGVALGGLFTSESMFHRAPDAGSLALAATAGRLAERGFVLWDVQTLSRHLQRFGAYLLPGPAYRARLSEAVALRRSFTG